MITDTLQAWVLHKTWSGETSARVTFLTKEQGILSCLCKGGRKPEKQAILQPFNPLWLVVKKYPNYFFMHSVESAAPALSLNGGALFSGLYINELLYHLSKTDAHLQIFGAYLETIKGLAMASSKHDMEILLRRFEWTLLQLHGYAFSCTEEAQTRIPIASDKHYAFVPDSGFYPVSQGLPGVHILAIAQDKLDNVDTLRVAKYLMRKAIDHLLGGVAIQTRKLYNPAAS